MGIISLITTYMEYDRVLALVVFFAFIFAVYFAIVPHEIAHGLMAKKNGDLTAELSGRLSLNPVVHFDLIGFLMLFTIGIGYAKPVPVNPLNFKEPRKGLFQVAIAGVVYNICAAFVCSFFYALFSFIATKADLSSDGVYYTLQFFILFNSLCSRINISLFLFNILPLGPLDGFKIIEAYAERDNKFIAFMRRYSNYILIGLYMLSIFADRLSGSFPLIALLDILGNYLSVFSSIISGLFNTLFTSLFGLFG